MNSLLVIVLLVILSSSLIVSENLDFNVNHDPKKRSDTNFNKRDLSLVPEYNTLKPNRLGRTTRPPTMPTRTRPTRPRQTTRPPRPNSW